MPVELQYFFSFFCAIILFYFIKIFMIYWLCLYWGSRSLQKPSARQGWEKWWMQFVGNTCWSMSDKKPEIQYNYLPLMCPRSSVRHFTHHFNCIVNTNPSHRSICSFSNQCFSVKGAICDVHKRGEIAISHLAAVRHLWPSLQHKYIRDAPWYTAHALASIICRLSGCLSHHNDHSWPLPRPRLIVINECLRTVITDRRGAERAGRQGSGFTW